MILPNGPHELGFDGVLQEHPLSNEQRETAENAVPANREDIKGDIDLE